MAEDEALAIRLLHSEGYYDASAISSLEQADGAEASRNGGLRAIIGGPERP